jgi:LSD1 subclass zinc finger protein
MPHVTHCPHCQKPLQIPDGAAGKPVRCPLCKQLFAVRLVPAAAVGKPADNSAGREPANGTAASAAPSIQRARSSSGVAGVSTPPTTRPSVTKPVAECPSCKAKLPFNATACTECGYVLQGDGMAIDAEGDPNLCPNPACGVANQPHDRICRRCSSPLPPPAGTMLHGRYRIEKLIAIGGFGAVYLATDTRRNNLRVAIKDMICAEPQEYAVRLSFFHREAEILRQLANLPIVPKFHDFVRQGQTAYLVMEYIQGQDLLKLMESNENKPFALGQVIDWGRSICDVLSHMHQQSPPVVHRDVKPDNIMLLEDRRSIKMVDFGTARDMGRSEKARLAAKTRVYTDGYAPPEQIIGKPEARSDLFALAGTLYHLATGKAPEGVYTARELDSQLNAANGPIPAGDRWFYELLKINLAEDLNDRYFSCQEFKADLERRQVTKEITCPKCRALSPVRQPYCSKCAEPLTDPAPPCGHCGKENRMGSRCCIFCGARLR